MSKTPKVSIARAVRTAKSEDKKLRAAAAKAKTNDSIQNFAAGLGIGTGNITSHTTYGFNPITRIRTELEWIHRGSWLGGVAVDLVADDMTRAGVEIKGELDPDQIEEIEENNVLHGVWNSVNDAVKWSRLYGGCLAVMLIDGQDFATPLRLKTVGKDQFKGLMVLDRWMVDPSFNDLVSEMGSNLGLPKFYAINTDAPAYIGKRVHYSRCLRLEGIRLPYWQRMMEDLWGISVLERLYDRMIAFDSATQGAAQLVYKSYIRTYKIQGLREIISAGGKLMENLQKFVAFMRQTQGIEGITLLDKEDEFEAHGNADSFSGLDSALMQFGQQLAGALQIPLVRLFGQSPSGFSTGDADIRNYYDGINQQQNRFLLQPLTTIYRCSAQSLGIKVPDGFSLKFRPLWQLQEKEKGEIATAVVTAVKTAKDGGIIGDQTALQELKQSSTVTGVFSNITQEDINAAEREPAPPANELLPGSEGGGANDRRYTADAVRPILTDPVDEDGLFKVPTSATAEDEIRWAKRRMDSVRIAQYADSKCGLPQTFDQNGAYLCAGRKDGGSSPCNKLNGTECLIRIKPINNGHFQSCGFWETQNAGDAEGRYSPKGKLDDDRIGFGDTENLEGFGCERCKYPRSMSFKDSEGRSEWCRLKGHPIQQHACCADNEPVPQEV